MAEQSQQELKFELLILTMAAKIKIMRLIFLLTVILLSSCESKKDTIVNRKQAIKKEMEQVKAYYYKKSDSLESVKKVGTNSARHLEIAEELADADRKKNVTLIPLQKEYDSLELELKKY